MKAKKLLSLVMAASLAFGTMSTASALRVNALSPVVGGAELLKDVKDSGADYSTVYYGGIPWRVLDKEFSNGQAEAANGIYLLSEYAYGHGTYWNAHYGPADYVWNRTGIYTRLDVQYHPNGYNGDPGNTSPTNLGYQESDIRKYMTGVGDYEAVFTRSMHEHGNPDNSGLNVSSYFEKIKVTASEPTPGVVYYVKGEFRLSNHEFNNYKTLAVTAEDWLPDTWYTYDSVTGEYNLVEQAPAAGESLVCYHDASEYYSVGTLEAFEPGVDYYTFEKINDGDPRWDYTKLELQANSIVKGALYCAFSVTDMKNSTSVDKEGEGRVILSGANTQNFASDMGFTTAEQAAVLPTSRKGATNGGATGNSKWTYKNSGAYSDELVNDTYFLPSAADLRTYLVGNGLSTKTTFANGDSAQYWLGSLLRYDRVGMVDSGGGEWYQHPTMKHLGIRPAFNLNPESVLMYRSTSEANAYAMTLLDSSRNFTLSNIQRAGDVLNVSYTGAQVGANEYISYVLKDKVSGEIVKYGQIANVTAESGDMSIDISNIDTLGYDMYIFNEQVNGEFESNYASEMTKVEYALDDYAFELTVSSNAIKATEELEVVVSIDRAYYSAEFTFTYDTDKFTCAQDTDGDGEIYVTNLYKGEAGDLRTYTLVAKNDITSVSKDNIIAVDGNVIQFKEQVLNDLKNIVTGDEESIKISLNYTAEIIEDYVSGYSLVLVRGDDGGYSYNGRKMFYVEGYNAYAILIEGEVTEAQVDEALAKTSNCKVIVNTYNVNGEYVTDGVVDLKDATVVYACSNKHFNIDEYMDLYLLADVNKDGHVYMDDVNAITACDLYVK